MLDIEKKIENEKAEFVLDGRLDTTTAPALDEAIKASVEGITELVLDFGALEYISSAGLRVLLGAQKIMAKQGGMKLINVNDDAMNILEVTGFLDILTAERKAKEPEGAEDETASEEHVTEGQETE